MSKTISRSELLKSWNADLSRLETEDTEKVAYDMVQTLVGAENFEEHYDGDERIAEIFDIVASLEVPMGVNEFGTLEEIQNAWSRAKELLAALQTETK